jgi:hypothetical protein
MVPVPGFKFCLYVLGGFLVFLGLWVLVAWLV